MRWFERLRRTSEIAFVRRRGRAAHVATLALYVAEASGREHRVGMTVSKAVGGAVVRNRVRRRIRGALESSAPLPGQLRLLFVAKPEAARADYASIAADVALVLERVARTG